LLENIINNLRETVPEAFVDKEPSIPWINEKTWVIDSREFPYFRESPIFPPIFVDPEVEVPETDEYLEGEVRSNGVEALAWYVPFHQSKRWGFYFRVRGICYLSNFFKNQSNIKDVNQRIKKAFEVLFYHEFFHFLTEITAAHMEMSYKKPLYNDYVQFIAKTKYGGLLIEEPLANAYVLKRIPKRDYPQVKKFFNIQPPPYSTFWKFIPDTDFLIGKRKLGAMMRIHDLTEISIGVIIANLPSRDEPFWEFLFNVTPEKLFLSDLPIYFVKEKEHTTSGIEFKTPIFYGVQIAIYPCDHDPPHIHIWIPADNRRNGRYLYPSLEPYMGAKPLSNKQRKKVQRVIAKYRNKIEEILIRQKREHILFH
jgi:hypothetical protein